MVAMPERSNFLKCGNYRKINLQSHPRKLLPSIMNDRLKRFAKALIQEEQVGFRGSRGIIGPILVRIFIDFKRVFEGVGSEVF